MFNRTHRITTLSIAAAFVLLLGACGGDDDTASTPPECPSSYRITFLPAPLLAGSSSALSLTNQTPSQAVGEIGGDAARWSGGSFSAIPNGFGGFNSIAFGINDGGQIVGGAETTTANVFHAFLFSAGVMTDLGTLGGSSSFATAINNAGQIVGSANTAGDAATHAFLRDTGGGLTDLGTLGGTTSNANAINNSGQIVGNSQLAGNGSSRAFLYNQGRMTDLGTLGGQNSSAAAINDAGQIVGSSQMAGTTDDHAFIYSQGRMRELTPSTISAASGINAKGHVVGRVAAPASPTGWHAFRYCGGTLTDLNVLIPGGSGELLDASDINDAGEIVGVGSPAASSSQQAVLLTPQ